MHAAPGSSSTRVVRSPRGRWLSLPHGGGGLWPAGRGRALRSGGLVGLWGLLRGRGLGGWRRLLLLLLLLLLCLLLAHHLLLRLLLEPRGDVLCELARELGLTLGEHNAK